MAPSGRTLVRLAHSKADQARLSTLRMQQGSCNSRVHYRPQPTTKPCRWTKSADQILISLIARRSPSLNHADRTRRRTIPPAGQYRRTDHEHISKSQPVLVPMWLVASTGTVCRRHKVLCPQTHEK